MEFAPPQFATIGGRRLAYEELSPEGPRGTVLLLVECDERFNADLLAFLP